jgi:hypothetical protein
MCECPRDIVDFVLFFIVVLGIYCDIYKKSYNVLWLNSPSPSFSFIPPPLFSGTVLAVYFVFYPVSLVGFLAQGREAGIPWRQCLPTP